MSELAFMETRDAGRVGRVFISQPERGYRFTSDTIALAEFIRIEPWESLLDFGTGVGVIPLLVWQRSPFRFALGVELQEELAQLARNNVQANSLSERIFILHSDLRSLTPANVSFPRQAFAGSRFDVVVANPPYLGLGRGRINPNSQKALARHEIELTFQELAAACQSFLKPGGRFYFVHLAEREAEITANLTSRKFSILNKQYLGRTAPKTLFLAEARSEADDARCS